MSDPSRLYTQLQNTGLQQKDNALYQVIRDLITSIISVNKGTSSSGGVGPIGPQGITGSQGPTGPILLVEDGIDGLDGQTIPIQGPQGIQGNTGATGPQGLIGNTPILPIIFFDGIDGEDGIPGPAGVSFAGGGSGALVLLEQHTASSSASLDFTTGITSLYDDYIIRLINVVPATANVSFNLLVSTNGGVSYDVSSNYFGSLNISSNTLSIATVFTSPGNAGLIIDNVDNTTSSGGVSGRINFYNPLSSIVRKTFNLDLNSTKSGGVFTANGMILWNVTTAINALRFLFSSGNIASGTIRLYGVAKS